MENKYIKRLVPYQWPWTDKSGQGYTSFGKWLHSRKFSLFYMITSIAIVSVLGYAARSNCDGPWQIVFQCRWTMWMREFRTDFWHFLITCFTTPWFHNDLAHIVFVALFGFLFPVQSFEAQNGTKITVILYFATYLFIGLFYGSLFNIFNYFWEDSAFVAQGFRRAWMGGSVGIFGIIGALSYLSRNKWFLISLIFLFEIFNLTVIGNNIYISIIHLASVIFGWLFCMAWQRRSKMKT